MTGPAPLGTSNTPRKLMKDLVTTQVQVTMSEPEVPVIDNRDMGVGMSVKQSNPVEVIFDKLKDKAKTYEKLSVSDVLSDGESVAAFHIDGDLLTLRYFSRNHRTYDELTNKNVVDKDPVFPILSLSRLATLISNAQLEDANNLLCEFIIKSCQNLHIADSTDLLFNKAGRDLSNLLCIDLQSIIFQASINSVPDENQVQQNPLCPASYDVGAFIK